MSKLARIALALVTGLTLAKTLHAQTYQPGNFVYFQGVRIKQAFTVDATATVTFNNASLTVNALTVNGAATFNSTSLMNDNLTFAGNKGISVPGTSSLVTIGHSLQVGPPASATTDTGNLQLLRANGTNKVIADFRAKMNAAAGTGDCGAAGSIVVRPGNGSFSAEMYQCAQDQSTIDRFLKVPDLTNTALVSPTITGTVAGGASYTSPTLTGTVAGGATYSSPNLTTPTIGGGVTIAYAGRCTASATINNIPAHNWNATSATCTGIQAGDDLICTLTAGSSDSNVMFGGCSAGSGTVGVVLGNMDDGATHSATQTLQVMFFR